MPITLSGSGTVTGISVGGLPDGVVDADTIANTVSTGKIIQVVEATYASAVTIQAGTGNTGLAGSITPTKANSKILVIANQSGQYRVNSDPGCSINISLQRSIASGSYSNIIYEMYLGGAFPNNRRSNRMTTLTKLDSPSYSVGQAINYRVQAGTYTSNYGLQYNAQNNGANNPSFIQMMEIAA
jgi:hypothetical protein|tara:strand:+ start:369 stop:920 length:552 start_codon:yes stop_codon:yes gene_type:complete